MVKVVDSPENLPPPYELNDSLLDRVDLPRDGVPPSLDTRVSRGRMIESPASCGFAWAVGAGALGVEERGAAEEECADGDRRAGRTGFGGCGTGGAAAAARRSNSVAASPRPAEPPSPHTASQSAASERQAAAAA